MKKRTRPKLPRSLFFLSDLDGGGAQRTMVNLVQHWPPGGASPVLAVGRLSGAGHGWIAEGLAPIDLGAPRLRQALLPLRHLIRRERPDILFSTMVGANIVAAASLIGLPRPPLFVARETNSHRARGDLSRLQRAAAGWVYRRAEAVVALSEGIRQELIEDYRLKPECVTTIHNPVDIENFQARAREAARPWNGDGPVIVAAGRLVRQKGFDILLCAFARIGRQDVRLAIIGEGPDRGELERLAAELGVADRLIMPGHVEDPAAWFAHAALFALSSRWEGFGHVLVEAMACGVPVVACDCPYGPADIIEHERTGLLLPPENIEALVAAMDHLIEDSSLSGRLAAAGREAASRFAAPAIAAKYSALFDNLCAVQRSRC